MMSRKLRWRLPRGLRLLLLACASFLGGIPVAADNRPSPDGSSWETRRAQDPRRAPGRRGTDSSRPWTALASLAALITVLACRPRRMGVPA
ncbi:MAG TPA: hypothetical protein VEB66_16915 [Opitutaceae bacterium]|nr:hypothetical protein [Opitutaceae bacterium]